MFSDHSRPLLRQEVKLVPKRSCTDVLFIPVFILFWCGMIALGYESFVNERYRLLTNGFDFNGNICGVGACSAHPYRYYPFDSQPFFAICVSECPSASSTPPVLPSQVTACPADTGVVQVAPILTNAENTDTTLRFRHFCISSTLTDRISDAAAPGQGEFTRAVEALGEAWRVLLLSVFVAMLGALLFVVLMRFCGGTVMLTLVLGVIACFGAGGWLLTTRAETYTDSDDSDIKNAMLAVGYICYAIAFVCAVLVCCLWQELLMAVRVIKEGTQAVAAMKQLTFVPLIKWLIMGCLVAWWCGVALCIVASGDLETVVLSECPGDGSAIASGCSRLRAALEALGPALEPPCTELDCAAYRYDKLEFTKDLRYALIYHVFGFYWNSNLILYLGEMVIAVATATWYFRRPLAEAARQDQAQGYADADDEERAKNPVRSGLRAAFGAHFGSLVLGSFVLSLVQVIRDILVYIQKKTMKKDDQEQWRVVKAVLCACTCCLFCLEHCLKFIMGEAFILMAIFGHNFCVSCRQSYGLISRNTIRLGALHLIGETAVIAGKFFIAIFTAFVCWFLMTDERAHSQLDAFRTEEPLLPTAVIFFSSWIIAGIFLQVYSATINTLMICFIVDEEVNGTAKHASKGLRQKVDKYGGDRQVHPGPEGGGGGSRAVTIPSSAAAEI